MKDSIIQFDKERRFHTMKLANRIFLFFGALSVISFVQFDAMGEVQDCNSVDAGRYCWEKSHKYACPAGCYCDGGRSALAVKKFYNDKTAFEEACALRTLTSMSGSGVHLCPSGETSNPAGGAHGAKESSDCFSGLTAWDGKQNCTSAAPKGKYCKHKDVLKEDCAPGCYCEGGTNAIGGNDEAWGKVTSACGAHWSNEVKDYLEARGVKYCPDGFPNSVKKAESKDDCYFEEDNERRYYRDYKQGIIVDAGYYLPKSKTTPTSCANLTGTEVCLGGKLRPSAASDVGITSCADGKISNLGHSDCVCPNGTEWDNALAACVSRYTVTYDCNGGTGTAPTDSNSPYLVGAAVTVKSNTCTAPSGRTFDKWNCDNGIGDMTTNHTFFMPSVNVTCNAKWKSAGNNGGGTQGGGSHSCQPGQYWSSGVDVRVDVRADMADMTNYQVGRSAKKAATKSVVSRAAMQPSPVSSMAKTLDAADLRSALGGSCKDCEVGYYCPGGTQGRVACPEGEYTNTTGQTQCLVCNGTVIQTGNLNTGCSTNPDNPGNTTYTVTYSCGEGGGVAPVDSNSYTSGASVILKSKGNCTAPSSTPDFDGWNCGNNIVGQAGDTIAMPAANVICTAQWTSVPAGTYTVQYACDEGTGVAPIDMTSPYISGGTAIALANTCTAPNGKTFSGWLCGNTSVIPDGSFTITANTTCVAQWTVGTGPETPVSCTTAGKYWDGDGCITCESGYFCPGNGQHYKCPFGGASTQNKASCVLNLNETQMEYNKCWLRYWNNAAAYRKCLYGIDLATLPH